MAAAIHLYLGKQFLQEVIPVYGVFLTVLFTTYESPGTWQIALAQDMATPPSASRRLKGSGPINTMPAMPAFQQSKVPAGMAV